MMNKTYEKGIYIHIPFCVHKCIYCDFLSAPAGDAVKYAYTRALINEIRNTADRQVKDKITSIYLSDEEAKRCRIPQKSGDYIDGNNREAVMKAVMESELNP